MNYFTFKENFISPSVVPFTSTMSTNTYVTPLFPTKESHFPDFEKLNKKITEYNLHVDEINEVIDDTIGTHFNQERPTKKDLINIDLMVKSAFCKIAFSSFLNDQIHLLIASEPKYAEACSIDKILKYEPSGYGHFNDGDPYFVKVIRQEYEKHGIKRLQNAQNYAKTIEEYPLFSEGTSLISQKFLLFTVHETGLEYLFIRRVLSEMPSIYGLEENNRLVQLAKI